MDKMRQFIALTVLGAIVLVAAGWFLLISPKRSEAADLRAQATSQQTLNGALRTQIAVLKAQAKELPAKQAQLAAVAAKIPENPALPALIRSLQKAADEADVELVSLAPAPPADLKVGGSSTGVAAAPAAPGAAPAAGAAAPTGSLKQINLNIQVAGGYFQVERFLDRMESMSRALKVTTLALAPGSNPVAPPAAGDVAATPDKVLAATIAAVVFMAPGRTTVPGLTAPAVGK